MPPNPNDPLGVLSPDGITAMVGAMASSAIAGLFEQVSGWMLLVASIGAAVLMAFVLPVAQSHGYTWSDWLGFIVVLTGVFAGTFFTFAIMVKRQWLSSGRDKAVADGIWSLTFGRLFAKKGNPDA